MSETIAPIIIIPSNGLKSNPLLDFQMSQQIGEALNKHYPGHLWAVRVHDGMAKIQNLLFSDEWGYVIRITDMGPDMKKVMRAGGEILARFKLSRGAFNADEFNSAERTRTGQLVQAK